MPAPVASGGSDRRVRIGFVEIGRARPGVIDIELDVVTGKRRAPGRPALRRTKAVPRSLRNDGDHSGANHEGLRRPVVADNVQGLPALENVNQLVLGMCFPMTCPCGLTGDEDTVAIGAPIASQSRGAPPSLFAVSVHGTWSASRVPR